MEDEKIVEIVERLARIETLLQSDVKGVYDDEMKYLLNEVIDDKEYLDAYSIVKNIKNMIIKILE